jgi:uncharacterized membrane protein
VLQVKRKFRLRNKPVDGFIKMAKQIYKHRKGVCTMAKGKFGLSLAAVAVIAFGFTALRQPQSVLLVAGFALLAEKDEWLNRQAMQALLLTIAYYLAELVTNWIFGGLARFFGWVKLYGAASALSTLDSFVGDVLYLALIVFSVLAVLRVLRGKDAELPFLSKMADRDIATALKSKIQTPEASAQTAPPVQAVPTQTQYPPPAQLLDSSRTPPIVTQDVPAPVPGLCPACSAPLYEDAMFCTECGAKTK